MAKLRLSKDLLLFRTGKTLVKEEVFQRAELRNSSSYTTKPERAYKRGPC